MRTRWKREIARRYGSLSNNIDLTKAVVSADTDERLLRFVFPYKGAKTVSIEHSDRPGALKVLTQILVDRNLNILSTLLRRGGASAGNAVLVAVCEPKGGSNSDGIFEGVETDLLDLPPEYLIKVNMNDGIAGVDSVYPRTPDAVVAHVPKNILYQVRHEQKRVPDGQIPIFVSRRFTSDSRAEQIARSVRDNLVANGCMALEASPEREPEAPVLIFNEVSAKMWIADAAIVLVVGLSGSDVLGKNLPYEAGFFHGQSKPVLLLVEGGSADSLRDWSNIYGIYAPHFAEGGRAFDSAAADSIPQLVKSWVEKLRH
ncbi:MAG: hypothetical protein AABO57_03380 [Acidobacteriota bacterium]